MELLIVDMDNGYSYLGVLDKEAYVGDRPLKLKDATIVLTQTLVCQGTNFIQRAQAIYDDRREKHFLEEEIRIEHPLAIHSISFDE